MINPKDKQLTCKDCNKPFVFTEGEQKFYAKMKYHPPSRCPDCRKKRKQSRQNASGGKPPRQKERREE